MEFSTTLPLPTTPLLPHGHVSIEAPSLPRKFCFDATGYLDQPCLDTSKRKEKLYLSLLEKSKFGCGGFFCLSPALSQVFFLFFGFFKLQFYLMNFIFFWCFFKKTLCRKKVSLQGW